MTDFYIPEKKIGEAKIPAGKISKDETNSWSIFFGILLTIVLIILYERTFADLPRFLNPYYQNCHRASLVLCEAVKYEATRLILYSAVVAPLLVVALIIYLAARRKTLKSQGRILRRAYFFSVLVAASHLFISFAVFLNRHYREIGIYVILGSFALAFIFLIVWLQKKHNNLNEAK